MVKYDNCISVPTGNGVLFSCCLETDEKEVINYLHNKSKKSPNKPPLGLEPRRIHDYHRVKDIVSAMNRYVEVDKVIPTEWAEELLDILYRYED